MTRFIHTFLLSMLAAALLLAPVSAQSPDGRPPGTTCVTPAGWCPAVQPGPPGAPCACQTPNGWVQGKLR